MVCPGSKKGPVYDKVYSVMLAGPMQSRLTDFVKAHTVKKDPVQLTFSIKNPAQDVGYYAKNAHAAMSTA